MAGVPSLMRVGFENVGPKPLPGNKSDKFSLNLSAFGAHTSNNGPNEQRQPKDWHNYSLDHEHVPQTAHMQPKQWQLNDDEQEKAQQLGAGDVCAFGKVVREVIEGWPDGGDHDLQTLPTLK